MGYPADEIIDQATELAGTTSSEIPKKAEPSCMREHIGNLQTDQDDLRQRLHQFDKRITKLEALVGV